jgi:L-alanine-DL-glutamate epimerase-like enolase superfamily enzyme
VRLAFARHTVTLASPLETSYGTVRERELLAVTLTDGAGRMGHGEAAPLPAYDGVSPARVETALARHADALARAGERPGAELLERCRRADPLPAAIAAVDMALWDRAGRIEDRPVGALLCERPARAIAVNATLSAVEPGAAAEQAARACAQGFRCLKLKVGTREDANRVAAVRAAAGPDVALRLDANGAWSVDQAVKAIRALGDSGLELVEEPVHGLAAMRDVRRRVAVPVSIDETAEQAGALAAGAADAVCLKISRFGGISGVLAAAALVRSSGAEVYLASTLDGPLGIAAALHAAAALSTHAPLRHCGLATLSLFADLENPLPAREGVIEVPSAAGLGVCTGYA